MSSIFSRWRSTTRRPACLLLPLAWCAHVAFAQPAPAPTADLVHTVQAGETLFGIADRFTGNPALWGDLQRHNRVPDPLRLPPGLAIRIPRAWLAPAPTYATVMYLSGAVRVRLPSENQETPAQPGQQLPEGSQIDVGGDGYLRLQMVDGSVARVPANSSLMLSRVRSQEVDHTTETRIDLKTGRVDAEVKPRETKAHRFEVETPLAVASVRGTQFGVEVQSDGTVTGDVTRGVVALRGARPVQARKTASTGTSLQAGQGARVDNTGHVGDVRPLPGAPDLTAVPGVLADASFLRFALPAAVGDVTAYRVRIARDAGLEDVLRNRKVPAGSDVQFDALDDGDYTLGVRAVDGVGLSGVESTRPLRVKARPVAPLIQQPSPDAVLRASAVEFACARPDGVERFRLQVARDPGFDTLVLDTEMLQECRHTAALTPGRYHWRVASIRRLPSGGADQGPFSSGRRFDLLAPPPTGPSPTARNDDGSLQLYWTAVPGYSYRVQVSRDMQFETTVYDQAQREPSLRVEHPPAGRYFVRIQTVDDEGNAGAFSPVQNVSVVTVLRDSDGNPVQDAAGQPVHRP